MSGRLQPWPWACAALAVACLVLAVMVGRGLDRGPDPLGPRWGLELAAGYDRAAEQALAPPGAARYELARRLTLRALALSPYDTSARLRLAYIETASAGRLGPAGIEQLRRSYELVPIDPYTGFWRIRFGLENWAVLPADLREKVKAEARAAASEPGHRYNLRKTLLNVRDPQGRLVAGLWMWRLFQSGN